MSLNKVITKSTALFCLLLTTLTVAPSLASEADTAPKQTLIENIKSLVCIKPVCVRRGQDMFYILNNHAHHGSLVYANDNTSEVIAENTGFVELALFRNKHVLGYTSKKKLFILAHGKDDQEFHMDDRSMIWDPEKVWNWEVLGTQITSFVANEDYLLLCREGSFSAPQLLLFDAPIAFEMRRGADASCGLNCTRTLGEALGTPYRRPNFKSLPIDNVSKISKGKNGQILIQTIDKTIELKKYLEQIDYKFDYPTP